MEAAIIDRMVEVFESAKNESLAVRLLKALEIGERLGGDIRGKLSAALKITHPFKTDKWYMYPNLRVDEHPEPVFELKRLLELYNERKKSWS